MRAVIMTMSDRSDVSSALTCCKTRYLYSLILPPECRPASGSTSGSESPAGSFPRDSGLHPDAKLIHKLVIINF